MNEKQAFWRDPAGMYGSFTCSACGGASSAKTRYCRRCGARMENFTSERAQDAEAKKAGGSAFDGVNWKWLLPLLLFPFASDPPRREISVTANVNGKSVVIAYDPHDPEAVKAADVWRKALFAPKDAPKDGNCLYVSDRVRYALDAIAYLSGNIDGRYAFIPLTDKQREAIDALYEDLHSREPFDEANLFKPGSYEPKDLPTKHNLMTELEKAAGLCGRT